MMSATLQLRSQFLINLATAKGGSCVQFAMKAFVKAFFGDEKEAKREEMMLRLEPW